MSKSASGPMTPAEFADAMRAIGTDFAGDLEAQHGKTDELMEDLLTILGYGEGVAIVRGTKRFYA